MDLEENETKPIITGVDPILAVQDVSATILYWQDVLGFPGKWTWGEPPTHGAVIWHGKQIQFTQNLKLAAVSEGHSLGIMVRNVDALYRLHQERNAEIISPLENKPWAMEEYTVREMNGYFLRFGMPVSYREKSALKLPPNIQIIARVPTPDEYGKLISAVGWGPLSNESVVKQILNSVVFAVVAENAENNEIVGCAFLLGDGISFYYVKDVMVHPDWQSKRIGTALMHELTNWIERHAIDNAYVGLHTGENLAPFYNQFGFTNVFGMHRRIRKNDQDPA
jgi:N-acetylglutamate synthase-like GNAT family acetyltransferase/uncharacterized glyoxalase superfamily protein PhnB